MNNLDQKLEKITVKAKNIINKNNINDSYDIDIIDFFPQSKSEEIKLHNELSSISNHSLKVPHGIIYILKEKISSSIGNIKKIKIREYDIKKTNYDGGVDLIIEDFDKYKENITFNDKINFISNDINDFIEYDDENIFLYIVRHSNIKKG